MDTSTLTRGAATGRSQSTKASYRDAWTRCSSPTGRAGESHRLAEIGKCVHAPGGRGTVCAEASARSRSDLLRLCQKKPVGKKYLLGNRSSFIFCPPKRKRPTNTVTRGSVKAALAQRNPEAFEPRYHSAARGHHVDRNQSLSLCLGHYFRVINAHRNGRRIVTCCSLSSRAPTAAIMYHRYSRD
jgi:hypothetical protein